MEKFFINCLCRAFGDFERREVEQFVRLAELRTENVKLAFQKAAWNMQTQRESRNRYYARMGMLDDTMASRDAIWHKDEFERYLDEEEWHGILGQLPLSARMLAHIAKAEAEAFAGDPRWVLSRKQREMLVAQIRRRFIAWHKRHSQSAYETAKAQLMAALQRNRKRWGYYGRKGKRPTF